MDQITDCSDSRSKGWCIHCGNLLGASQVTRDHVPSKSLLHKPYPDNLPVVDVCQSCNAGFSPEEEYLAAFLGAVISGSTTPDPEVQPVAGRILRRNRSLRQRIARAKTVQGTLDGQQRVEWTAETDRIARVIVKNARGHVLYESGEPVQDDPHAVSFSPLVMLNIDRRSAFEDVNRGSLWPEVGSRMMQRMVTGQDLIPGWIVVQPEVYRYAVIQEDGLITVRSVLQEYLATEVAWSE